MRTPIVTLVRAGLGSGLVAVALPLAAASAVPAVPSAAPAQAYGGFASSAWATPIRMEIYEPSIPIPAEPQAELDIAYSMVKADSGMSQGRGSWMWPGDPVGEGFKTFGDQLGLPEELTKDGYQTQVNSRHPSDRTSEADEPFPGTMMRTSSEEGRASAKVGFSSDGEPNDPDAGDGAAGGSGGSGGSGESGDPGGGGDLLGGLNDQLGQLGRVGSAGDSVARAPADEDEPAQALPAELAALIDAEGMVSTSRTNAQQSPVVASSRSALGEIRLLEGLLTIGGVDTRAKATTDGQTGRTKGRATYGTLALNGSEFSLGPDGAVADGEPVDIPGLNEVPAEALAQLGISFAIPEPVREVEGDKATSVSEALRIYIDTEAFAEVMAALPSEALAELVPEDAGPLKGFVSGLNDFTPLIVITLGTATAAVDTVPPVEIPPLADVEDSVAPSIDTGTDAGADADSGGALGSAPDDVTAQPTESAPSGAGDLTGTALASSNLPPLFSIPGMLLMGALVLGAVAGNWMRIIGAKALAGGATCTHGLESGVPDLRKARS